MKHIANPGVLDRSIAKRRRPASRPRPYESPLREGQAEATRERILEALIRIMARGLAEVSIPAVAQEAGVSIPTVYRHFASKKELFAALGPYAAQQAGLMLDNEPWTLEDEPQLVRTIYRRAEAIDSTLRAAMASQIGMEMRRQMMPRRLGMHRDAVARSLPDLTPDELERFARVLLLLHSSAVLRAFKDYFGASADEAAEDVIWATRTLLRGSRDAITGREGRQ
jgi:AcrR family transcriptional regulator